MLDEGGGGEEQGLLFDMDFAGDLLGGFDGISRICEKMRVGTGEKEDAVGSGISGEIANVGGSGDEQSVDLKFGEAGGESKTTLVNFSQTNSLAGGSLLSTASKSGHREKGDPHQDQSP